MSAVVLAAIQSDSHVAAREGGFALLPVEWNFVRNVSGVHGGSCVDTRRPHDRDEVGSRERMPRGLKRVIDRVSEERILNPSGPADGFKASLRVLTERLRSVVIGAVAGLPGET